MSGLILTLTLTLVHPTRIHPSKNEKKRLEFLEKRLEFLEFKVGGLALRLLHADLVNRRANGAVRLHLMPRTSS